MVLSRVRVTADTARPTKRVSVGADAVGDAPLSTCSTVGKQKEMVLDSTRLCVGAFPSGFPLF